MARQVAHDIKNPLTPIQLSAEHAQRVNIDRGRPLSPVLDECVTAILSQVRLLRQISRGVLELRVVADAAARADRRSPPLDRRGGRAVSRRPRRPHRDRGATPTPDLPACSIDRTLFARALTNVIENALHAMPGGGPARRSTPALIARSAAAARSIVVEVTDTGVGMDQDALARIFEPYFSTKATGTGLGLTIAKRNVELNGGTIAVRQTKGVGTTVTIELASRQSPVASRKSESQVASPVTAVASHN